MRWISLANLNQKTRWVAFFRSHEISNWRQFSPLIRRLVAIGAFLLVTMVLAVSIAVLNMRQVAIADASRNIHDLGTAVAEQTTRSIQAVDVVLLNERENIAAAGIKTPDDLRTRLASAQVYQTLREQLQGLPQANAFTIIDAHGQLVNFSRRWPVPPTNLADRDYFVYLQSHDDQSAMISEPLQNRGDGTWTVYVIRRIDGPHGVFLGLLLGAVNLKYFDDFYADLTRNSGVTIYLMRRDGTLLASHPFLARVGKITVRHVSPWWSIVSAGVPSDYETQSITGHGRRLIWAIPLAAYPLVIDISVYKNAVLANWRVAALLAAAGTASAMLCMIVLIRALIAQLQRLERSKASLAAQNEALVKIEEKIRYLAQHDDLTKLVNRRFFREKLDAALAQTARAGGSTAVLYLDLDRFKLINDTKGHGSGDALLVQVAQRLQALVREVDTVARTGGDEFAIIQPHLSDPAASTQLATAILQTMNTPFTINDMPCRIGVSIGIARFPEHAASAPELLRNADMALYRAKETERGSYCLFDRTMGAQQRNLFRLEQDLRAAIELGQFSLDYQPILDTQSLRIVRCEALLRWRHPERGMIPPGDFISLAETLGLIIPIGHWVYKTACAEAMNWPADVSVAVNLSPAQFKDDTLIDTLTDILAQTGLAPNRLALEITEGLLLQDHRWVVSVMKRLRRLGIRFNLDDFGTGNSGLGYLRQFPFDGIKIDKLFVQDMVEQPQAHAIVAAILTISEALNLDVIAEGVETEAQLSELRDLRCRHVQGYLTGRPQSVPDIRNRLRENIRTEVE
jgi:diguanylate cyclase (GGDEF)-like protein